MIPVALHRLSLPVAALLVAALVPALTGSSAGASASSVPAGRVIAKDGEDVALPFSKLEQFRLVDARRVMVKPRAFVASRLDVAEARSALAAAPTPTEVGGGATPVEIALPAPDGSTAVFSVVEDTVMEPELAARHPELRTYAGTGITDPTDTIRFDITPLGFHASVRSLQSGRTWYVDPAYYGRGTTAHVSYSRSALPRHDKSFVQPAPIEPPGARTLAVVEQRAGETVTQRTYRMAFTTTPSYATYFGTSNVMATKVTQINRTNHMYMDDMAIKFVLVNETEKLNLNTMAKATGANGPCGANACFAADEIESCGGSGIDRNNFVTGQIIGADNFDIGHLGSGAGSGGVAYLGVVGGELKAGGCTALDTPTGDFYTVDFFAHEVGHQMGGNHTFDGNNGSCAAPNRNAETSVEPGSGSSIMAYAGICLSDDLQPHSDPYFSQRTIDEFTTVTSAVPTTLAEQQVVNLASLDDGDTFQLTYGNAAPRTITMGATYTVAGLEAALLLLTGKAVTVTGYDGASSVDATGFTADWPDQLDASRLGIGTTTGGVTGFVGVTLNGGPITNRGIQTVTTNRLPVVVAPADKTLPIGTPFALTGSATDADADQAAGLTYLWEQNDPGLPGDPILGTGPGTLLSSPVKVIGPLFRVFGTLANVSATDTLLYNSPGENLADTNPTRSFPDVQQILAGATNAEGNCPVPTTDPSSAMEGGSLDCYSEFLPDAAYALISGELNFRLTVRDGSVLGGGTGHDDVTLTLDPSAGPFLVTSRATADTTATANATETVEWDVAGTDGASFAPTVKISLSTDGGLTFPRVLAASTPNDGSEAITLPNVTTTKARIKIEAIGNYFFDVNNADFAITGGVEPPLPTRPQTRITGGVAKNAFVVGARARYVFNSSQNDSTFECKVDAKPVTCGNRVAELRKLRPGTHTFSVAARNAAGRADTTPAKRRFSVVYNDDVLTRDTQGWKRLKNSRAYGKSLLTTKRENQVLSYKARRVVRLALLVSTARGYGRLAVFLDGARVGTVNLSTRKAADQVLVPLKSFKQPKTGTINVRTLDGKVVRVDGIGVFNP